MFCIEGKRSAEANIEEDYCNDLLLFMTLLNTLHNIDNDFDEPKFVGDASISDTNTGLSFFRHFQIT